MLNALIVLVVVAVLGTVLYWVLNRKTTRGVIDARRKLHERAQALELFSVGDFLNDCGLTGQHEQAARKLLSTLAEMLNVAPERVAHDYPLRDLLTIAADAVEPEATEYSDPFSYDLIERVASLSDKGQWEKRWRECPELPRNEDGLADFILGMTVGEFLQFFSPLTNQLSDIPKS